MKTKILPACEAMNLALEKSNATVSIEEIMHGIKDRASSGFEYWMTPGTITEETKKLLLENGYRVSEFKNNVIQIIWNPN